MQIIEPFISGIADDASKMDDGRGIGGDKVMYEVGVDSRVASFE
jgi:hypothetical protein